MLYKSKLGWNNMRGQYGCRQCQCEPEDKYCSCLCHEELEE
jgi:hypothetical protein